MNIMECIGALGTVTAMIFSAIACLRASRKQSDQTVRTLSKIESDLDYVKGTTTKIEAKLEAERGETDHIKVELAELRTRLFGLEEKVSKG